MSLDRARRLKDAFEKLTPQQKTVVELAYYEGLSQTEMAERMQQPLGTVKTWIRSALKILREQLTEAARRMTCEDLRDSYELYSLGLLDGEEKREVEAHLGRNCAVCQKYFKDALAVNALMLSQAHEVVPPSRLRRRVMASVGMERAGWVWVAALAAACLLIVALWLSLEKRTADRDLADARRTLQQTVAERDRLEQAFTFLNQPETRQVNFGQGQPTPPRGNFFLNPRMGVLLIASNLPALPAGKTYEMWVIPKGGTAASRRVCSNPDRRAPPCTFFRARWIRM